MKPSFATATLGCKVNQYETESLTKELLEAGFDEVPFSTHADCYIINTCKVTAETEAKSRKIIRRAKRVNPNSLVVVTGCYEPKGFKSAANALGADIFVENSKKGELAKIILAHQDRFSLNEGSPGQRRKKPKTRGLLKIQDGCDQRCSYCVIPSTRGTPFSRDIPSIIKEAQEMADGGIKEIVLTGINLGSFGVNKDKMGESTNLKEAIEAIIPLKGIERIRLSSIDPNHLSDSLISLIANEPKLAAHIHLPLQSGSERILAAMNRKYTPAEFFDRVQAAKKTIPNLALTTDIMVGFPGESDEDFFQTFDLARKACFYKMHVFKFSKREGTLAAQMEGQVRDAVKEERSKLLIELSKEMAAIFLKTFLERRILVLVETYSPKENCLRGLTDNYIKVKSKGDPKLVGEIVPMRAVSIDGDGLFAEIM